jgi:hypothetical protein
MVRDAGRGLAVRAVVEDADDGALVVIPEDRDIRQPTGFAPEDPLDDGVFHPLRAEPQDHPLAAEVVPDVGIFEDHVDQGAGRRLPLRLGRCGGGGRLADEAIGAAAGIGVGNHRTRAS